METVPENQDWLDQVQTGRLDPVTRARWREALRNRPAEAARLEDELRLNSVLGSLPAAPVSSNFAARVMAEIESVEAPSRRRRGVSWGWLHHLRFLRSATVTALLALTLAGWWQFRLRDRQKLAASVSAVTGAATMPGVEWLTDFDAIQLLRTPAQPGDVELIAALATP